MLLGLGWEVCYNPRKNTFRESSSYLYTDKRELVHCESNLCFFNLKRYIFSVFVTYRFSSLQLLYYRFLVLQLWMCNDVATFYLLFLDKIRFFTRSQPTFCFLCQLFCLYEHKPQILVIFQDQFSSVLRFSLKRDKSLSVSIQYLIPVLSICKS